MESLNESSPEQPSAGELVRRYRAFLRLKHYSPNGRLIATAGADNFVRLTKVPRPTST